MTEKEKQEVAAFRFSIIHEFVNGAKPEFGEQEKLLQEKCDKKWDIPCSDRTSIGRSTILRWISLYRERGGDIAALFPKDREDKGKARVYDKDTCLGLIQLRKELPKLPVRIIRDKAKKRGILPADAPADLSTLYRFLNAQGLMGKEPSPAVDRRKFEAEYPNDLWQSDVMHGPKLQVGAERARKVYLIACIDDHTRLITHGEFYVSESLGHPNFGASWETLAMETIIAAFPDWEPFFYRTAAGTELDLVLIRGNRKLAFEFKASTTPHVTKGFWNGLRDLDIEQAWIIAPIDEEYPLRDNITVCPLSELSKITPEPLHSQP